MMALVQFVSLPVTKPQLLHGPSIPLSAHSELVLQANGAVRELLDSTTFVECFQSFFSTIRSNDSLLETEKDKVVKLGDESAAVLQMYWRTCDEILGKLRITYKHILNAEEDKAMELFTDIAKGTIEEVIFSTKNLQVLYEDAYKVFDKKARESRSPPAATELERFERELAEIVVRYEKDFENLKRIRLKLKHSIPPTHDATKARTSSTEAVGEDVHSAEASAFGNSAKSSLSEDETQGLTEALTSPLVIWKQHPSSQPVIRSPNTRVGIGPNKAIKTLVISLLEERKRTLIRAREYQDQLEAFHETLLDNTSEDRASASRTLCHLNVILSFIAQATKFWSEASDYYKTSAGICSMAFRNHAKELLSIIPERDRMKKWNSDEFQFTPKAIKFVALWTSLASACDESARKISATVGGLSGDRRQKKKDESYETLKKKIIKFMENVRKEEEQLKKQEGQIKV